MHLTVTGMGLLCLAFFVLFHIMRILPRVRAVLALLGAVSVGTAGFVGHMFAAISTWLASATGSVTAWAFGSAVPVLLFLILGALLVADLHPTKGRASHRTGILALLVGVMLAGSAAAIPALIPVVNGMHSLLASVTGAVNTL